MYSFQEKLYRLENALNRVNDCDNHLSDCIRDDWKNIVLEVLLPYKQYGGDVEEKVDYICAQYCSKEGIELDSMVDIAFDKFCECLVELANLVNSKLTE